MMLLEAAPNKTVAARKQIIQSEVSQFQHFATNIAHIVTGVV